MSPRGISRIRSIRQQHIKTLRPTDKQVVALKILMHLHVFRVLFDGGARSGKTFIIIRFLVNCALQLDGISILIVRKELSAAKTSSWITLVNYLVDYVPYRRYRIYYSDHEVHFSNKSVIYVDGLDDKERVEKIRGREYCIVFVNEATDTNYASVSILIDRLAQVMYYPGTEGTSASARFKQMLILDCNPKHPRHWIYKWCMEHIDPESGEVIPEDYVLPGGEYVNLRFHRLNWSAFDNAINLSVVYLETLKHLPRVRKLRMLNGLWVENEGAVYEEFEEDIHTCEPFPIPNTWRRYRAIDFGFRNPFCCLWIAQAHDNRLFVYAEHYKARKTIPWHAAEIKRISGGDRFDATVTDWEAQQRADLEAEGISVIPAEECKSVRLGIGLVKNRLLKEFPEGKHGTTSLTVFKTCDNTINEFFSYTWQDVKSGRNENEEPVDANNHALSGLRYIITYLDLGSASAYASILDDNERAALTEGF